MKAASTLFLLSALAVWVEPARSTEDPAPPKDVGLVERSERRLLPLTVRIRALAPQYRSEAAHLTKEDFSVILDLKEVLSKQFELDNFCPDVEAERPQEQTEAPKHLLFFVNQMDMEGWENTHAMLLNMIPQLASAGYRLRILPGAESSWTADADRLLLDVERLFEPSIPPTAPIVESSESRVRAFLASNEIDQALAAAQDAELAEQLTLEGPSLQLERAIAEMAELPVPKALIYFADSRYTSRERIVEAALRSGVAIYAVKADGAAPYDPAFKVVDDPGAITTSTLLSLSEHTGGRVGYGHFRKSASDKILKGVEADLSCVYVLSLDTAGLDRNRALRPKISLRPGFKGQLVAESIPEVTIPSEPRQQAEAASIALRSGRWPGIQPAGVALIPIGFDGARVNALIQMTLSSGPGPTPLPTTWDVGLNYFGASRFSGYGNVRVTFQSPQVVFQKQASLPIGPYWVVGIAQEVDGRGLARGTEVGALIKPNKRAVEFLHALDIMQRGAATFVSENGTTRTGGWSRLRYGMANSDRPIALDFSLCRGTKVRGPLTIEKRLLLPDSEIRFPSADWPQALGNPCLVVNDEPLAAGRLPWSNQPYEATFVVQVIDAAGRTVARASNAFWVIGPAREFARQR
jgi:hypothetical protein